MIRLNEIIKPTDMYPPVNKLEALCLLATGEDGECLQKTLKSLTSSIRENNKNLEAAKSLDLIVFIKKSVSIPEVIQLQKIFKNVKLAYSDIPEANDFYYRSVEDVPEGTDLAYGIASGANYSFFEIMPKLSEYNTTLTLECDCNFFGDWISKVSRYVEHAGGFLVAGSSYNGILYIDTIAHLRNHVNGGCALYATGHSCFKKYIQYLHNWFLNSVKSDPKLSYDCSVTAAIFDRLSKTGWEFQTLLFLDKNIVKTNLLCDLSPTHDAAVSLAAVRARTKAAIIHKKVEAKKTLAFMHIPKTAGTFFFNSIFLPYYHRNHLQESVDNFTNLKVSIDGRPSFNILAATSGIDVPFNDVTTAIQVSLEEFKSKLWSKVKKLYGFKVFSTTDLNNDLPIIEDIFNTEIEYITLLRSPILREQSLFYYLRDCGQWEKTYDAFPKNISFEEFVFTDSVSSNWLTKWLSSKFNKGIPSQAQYDLALARIQKCKIIGFANDRKETTKAIKAFEKRYFASRAFLVDKQPQKWMMNRNTVSDKKPITKKANKRFAEINKLDIALFRHFRDQGDCLVSG